MKNNNSKKNIAKQKQNSRRSSKKSGYIFLILLGAAALFFFAIQAYKNNLNHDRFYDNIYIDGHPVGGLTQDQATEQLTNAWQDKARQVDIRLLADDKEWSFDHTDIQLTTNYEQLLEEAYQIGRGEGLFSRITEIYRLKDNPVHFSTDTAYETGIFLPWLDEIANELNQDPVDAVLSFEPDAEEMFQISKEQPGKTLKKELALSEITSKLQQGDFAFSIQLQFEDIQPLVSQEDFEGKTEKLITFGTDLSKSAPVRTNNVVLAASQFNGVVLQPDEILSFNGLVGERTVEKGYGKAPMIVADKSLQDAVGGGVSQTSTTLYNAAIRAGLDVVEYLRHAFPSSYIERGLDTTVNLPHPVIDIKVKNTRSSPIYFKTFYANQKVYFEIYGPPLPNGRTVQIRTDEYEVVAPPPPEIRQDTEGRYVTYKDERYTHVPTRNGYKIRIYRDYVEDGKVVETELLDDHYYRPIAGIFYAGVKDRPQVVPDTGEDTTNENPDDGGFEN